MKMDSQLQLDVGEELKWKPQLAASHVGVEVEDGVVTLWGASSYAEKWNSERTALRVSGVKASAVDLAVTQSAPAGRPDADIARAAENVVSWSTLIPRDAIKVTVENGFVELTGTVDWQFNASVPQPVCGSSRA